MYIKCVSKCVKEIYEEEEAFIREQMTKFVLKEIENFDLVNH